MAALNAKKQFAVAAFAPGLLNVALLLARVAGRNRIKLRDAQAQALPGGARMTVSFAF